MTNNRKDDFSLNFISPGDIQKMHQMSFESMEPPTVGGPNLSFTQPRADNKDAPKDS